MNALEVQPCPVPSTGPTNVFANTSPLKVKVTPVYVPAAGSTYMLASMILLPVAPGEPNGVYQYGSGSPIVFACSVSGLAGPAAKVALRSAVPQPLPNW